MLKRLTAREAFWVGKFRSEIDWYRYFARHAPPVSVPKLLAADSRGCGLLMTRAAGLPLARERYVGSPLPMAHVDSLLAALRKLHRWHPRRTVDARAVRGDYAARLRRYFESGALRLDSAQCSQVLEAVRHPRWEPEFNHGDLLLGNCLQSRGKITLIDWEFAGYYLPGYDLALLWLLLANDPGARARIDAQVLRDNASGYRLAFTINRLLLIGRETRIHSALEESEPRTQRLEQLDRDLQTAWGEFLANPCNW